VEAEWHFPVRAQIGVNERADTRHSTNQLHRREGQ